MSKSETKKNRLTANQLRQNLFPKPGTQKARNREITEKSWASGDNQKMPRLREAEKKKTKK